jgi:hypothetical protein
VERSYGHPGHQGSSLIQVCLVTPTALEPELVDRGRNNEVLAAAGTPQSTPYIFFLDLIESLESEKLQR